MAASAGVRNENAIVHLKLTLLMDSLYMQTVFLNSRVCVHWRCGEVTNLLWEESRPKSCDWLIRMK